MDRRPEGPEQEPDLPPFDKFMEQEDTDPPDQPDMLEDEPKKQLHGNSLNIATLAWKVELSSQACSMEDLIGWLGIIFHSYINNGDKKKKPGPGYT